MDFIIYFFRDTVDGWIYYTLLLLNIILIFAIIGYLAEKKERELAEYEKDAQVPVGGVTNLSTPNRVSHGGVAIPTVARTEVAKPVTLENQKSGPNVPLQNVSDMVIPNSTLMQNNVTNTNNDASPAVQIVNANNQTDIK